MIACDNLVAEVALIGCFLSRAPACPAARAAPSIMTKSLAFFISVWIWLIIIVICVCFGKAALACLTPFPENGGNGSKCKYSNFSLYPNYCCKKRALSRLLLQKKEEVSSRTPPLERIHDLRCKSHKTHSCLSDHDLAAVDDVDSILGVEHAHALEVVYHVVLVEEVGVDLLDG